MRRLVFMSVSGKCLAKRPDWGCLRRMHSSVHARMVQTHRPHDNEKSQHRDEYFLVNLRRRYARGRELLRVGIHPEMIRNLTCNIQGEKRLAEDVEVSNSDRIRIRAIPFTVLLTLQLITLRSISPASSSLSLSVHHLLCFLLDLLSLRES